MKYSVAFYYLQQAGLRIGGLRALITYRRLKFIRENTPEGATINELFMALVDDAIAEEVAKSTTPNKAIKSMKERQPHG